MTAYGRECRVENAVLHVRLSGDFPHERLSLTENLFKPIIDQCLKENCREVIVDARELRVDFNTVAVFRAGVDAVALNSFALRVAVLARPDMVDPFFEDVTYNRAAPVRVFTDLADAASWIRRHRQPSSS